jgi:hypothetical protein
MTLSLEDLLKGYNSKKCLTRFMFTFLTFNSLANHNSRHKVFNIPCTSVFYSHSFIFFFIHMSSSTALKCCQSYDMWVTDCPIWSKEFPRTEADDRTANSKFLNRLPYESVLPFFQIWEIELHFLLTLLLLCNLGHHSVYFKSTGCSPKSHYDTKHLTGNL